MAISLKLRAAWILDWTWGGGGQHRRTRHAVSGSGARGPTDLALLAVQIELVLADGHGPDGLDEGGTGVPGMNSDAAVTKGPSGHRRPTVEVDTRPPYIH